MRIAILDDYQDAARRLACFSRLKGHDFISLTEHVRDPKELGRRLDGVEAIVLIQQRMRMPREAIDQLRTVRLISQTGRRTTHIDVEACTQKGIAVCAGGVSNSYTTAEFTWGLLLAAVRHIPLEVQALKSGRWQSTVGTQLYGRTLGVYAYGKIGSLVANYGRAFGMKVVCWGREGSTTRARQDGFEIAPSREAFFESCDFVSLHLPLNKETRGIVTAEDLARMQPHALLVNTSRSGLIGDTVLADALKTGRPGRAAVDVYDDEPVLGASNPLLQLDNCLCTPHLGYVEQDTYESYIGSAFDQVVAYAAGKPINVVNPEALAR
jgi:D-3-phosphoglycerate dehydrogenase